MAFGVNDARFKIMIDRVACTGGESIVGGDHSAAGAFPAHKTLSCAGRVDFMGNPIVTMNLGDFDGEAESVGLINCMSYSVYTWIGGAC